MHVIQARVAPDHRSSRIVEGRRSIAESTTTLLYRPLGDLKTSKGSVSHQLQQPDADGMLWRVRNHRVDLTPRTQGGLPNPPLVFIDPSRDLAGRKHREAVKAPTLRSSFDRLSMLCAAKGIQDVVNDGRACSRTPRRVLQAQNGDSLPPKRFFLQFGRRPRVRSTRTRRPDLD